MLNASWAALLRQIPADQHDTLMVRTVNGTEIAVQNLLRIDFEFVIFKGRLAGSQDTGRLFILPYRNVDYFNFNRDVKDEEYNTLFAALAIPDPDTHAAAPAAPAAKLSVANGALPSPVAKPNRAGIPVKSSVLERFRTRNSTPVVGAGFEETGA